MMKIKKTCEIIIPIYNNAAVLPKTLKALRRQEVPRGWSVRVILTDDGSTDDSVGVARLQGQKSTWEYEVLQGKHGGPTAARNRALAVAQAEVLLWLGADIILRAGALKAHLDFHELKPEPQAAALGWIMWDPLINPSALMEWMTHGGYQNDYDSLLGKEKADPKHFFYGSNISLKRQFLGEDKLSADFKGYGWEDLELGRRLAKKGMELKVLHGAVGLHHHYYNMDDIVNRQEQAGYGLGIYQRLHPSHSLLPLNKLSQKIKYQVVTKSGFYWLLKAILRKTENDWSTPRLFQAVTIIAFWKGVLEFSSG